MQVASALVVQANAVKLVEKGNHLTLEMPYFTLFLDNTADKIDPAAADYLDSLAGTITEWLAYRDIALNIVIGTGENPNGQAAQKAVGLAQALQQRNVPARLIRAGVDAQMARIIHLDFTLGPLRDTGPRNER